MSASRLVRLKMRGRAISCTSRSGCACASWPIRGPRKCEPKPSGAPIRTMPETLRSESVRWLCEASAIASMLSAEGSSFSPSAVSL